ncbi:MAG: flagellar basal-body rod modification protein FlgD [Halieaceae bacterium]|jgi:flagellar basal-body rod modification protein FlgD
MDTLASLSELFPPSTPTNTAKANSVEEMGSGDFLTLMVAQLENQDPTKPMDNMQFVAQLAQFGTVSGIQELNEGFSGLSMSLSGNQALEAASLVGRSVMVDGNVGSLRELPASDGSGESEWQLNATVDMGRGAVAGRYFVQDLSGRLLHSGEIPPGNSENVTISWNGRDVNGNLQAPGSYRVSAEALVNGRATTVPVYAHQEVDSVAVETSTGEVTLNLASGRGVPINEVKQFF